ncbi:putative holin-like toxin [Gordoniibacillus kamchatkensis]
MDTFQMFVVLFAFGNFLLALLTFTNKRK